METHYMLMKLLNVIYLLVAIAMVALILVQRGAGAAAGSGFGGGGASGSVFGAQGAANFLSKTTKWLAVVFFTISLFMAWFAAHKSAGRVQDLGIMSRTPSGSVETPAGLQKMQPAVPGSTPTPVPAAQPQTKPVAPTEKQQSGAQGAQHP